MKPQSKTYRLFSCLLLLILVVSVACSSDDNTLGDEDHLIDGSGYFSMKLDGEVWSADVAYISTIGGPEWWDEDDEHLYLVTINATKYLDDSEDSENAEIFAITLVISEEKFTNPKDNYLAPPPDNNDEAGYSWAHYASTTDNISFMSLDPSDESRLVGSTTITDFKIGNQSFLGEGYVSLSGNFEYEVFGWDQNSDEFIRKKATEGSFNVTNPY